jgi:hypothetical protein
MAERIEPGELARRCQIHSAKMDEEGHYLTANILFEAANEIERLREMAAGYLEEVKRAYSLDLDEVKSCARCGRVVDAHNR